MSNSSNCIHKFIIKKTCLKKVYRIETVEVHHIRCVITYDSIQYLSNILLVSWQWNSFKHISDTEAKLWITTWNQVISDSECLQSFRTISSFCVTPLHARVTVTKEEAFTDIWIASLSVLTRKIMTETMQRRGSHMSPT